MRNIEEIIKEQEEKHYGEEYYMDSDIKPIKAAMIAYAKEVIDEMVSRGEYHELANKEGLIYCSQNEALYDYDKIEQFKNSLDGQ